MSERLFVTSRHSNSQGSCVEVSAPVSMRTSSYSGPNGGNCVEVGIPETRTSSFSGGNGGNCVEIGSVYDDCVMIGDTKIPNSTEKPYLHVSSEAFAAFTGSIMAREFADIQP